MEKKILAVFISMLLSLTMGTQTVMAVEKSTITEKIADTKIPSANIARVPWTVSGVYGAGVDVRLEHLNVNSVGNGNIYTYNSNYIKIKPAWKAMDSTTSEVELEVRLYRKWQNQLIFARRFKLSDDTDGHKDSAGWWYAESQWIRINNGSDYYIQYEFYTADGYTGTGSNRRGTVTTWVATKN